MNIRTSRSPATFLPQSLFLHKYLTSSIFPIMNKLNLGEADAYLIEKSYVDSGPSFEIYLSRNQSTQWVPAFDRQLYAQSIPARSAVTPSDSSHLMEIEDKPTVTRSIATKFS
ncbi:hypothetical protein ONS95_008715 [Cadophora gregata]|uniref:uncharacterized protein n=1 Tax=Cadophora gregata TaxID=51156 RepID=UPI0026DD984C|nr:uncharacterized protein ONS95_008715 [Cadophora gregata]KAK0123705.1 hypothetical protein ONS95_008715 [Cadophora gregata]